MGLTPEQQALMQRMQELGYQPSAGAEEDDRRRFMQAAGSLVYAVSKRLDDGIGPLGYTPDPERPDALQVYPYGNRGEIVVGLRIGPIIGDLGEEFKLLTDGDQEFRVTHHKVGEKEWRPLRDDEDVPPVYLQAVLEIEESLVNGRKIPVISRTEKTGRKSRGFLRRLFR